MRAVERSRPFHEPFLIFLSCFWSLCCTDSRCMAATHPLPAPGQAQNSAADSRDPAAENALVPTGTGSGKADPTAFGGIVSRLPVELDVAIPVREFRVRNLLALKAGELIESQWANGEDLPLAAGDVQLAWSEFEVLDAQLAVRITHLA
jgi:flagellar motor switch/type III secretory pathway protein FliN